MVKTSELTGAALDWAVAKCGEWDGNTDADLLGYVRGADGWAYNPSIDWSQGGAIIEWERICLTLPRWDGCWTATKVDEQHDDHFVFHGPTPLIAAMRCYVASKLGEEVDVPNELKGETSCPEQ